jgi:ATP-dependent helicase/nuclease subunit B
MLMKEYYLSRKFHRVISDREREFLKEGSVELSPTLRESLFIQKFYTYLNFTKPSEKLLITYSRSTVEGKPLRPSYLIKLIQELFTDMEIHGDCRTGKNSITSFETAVHYLAGELPSYRSGKMGEEARELLGLLDSKEEYREKVQLLMEAVFPEGENPNWIRR